MSPDFGLTVRPFRRPPARRVFAALVLSLFIAVWPAVLGSSALIGTAYAGNGLADWAHLARSLGLFTPMQPLSGLLAGPNALPTGGDGRLTILLLGSDTRSGGVARTDTIMIMSIKNGVVTVASIPRDTARIPNPDGGTFSGRINAILKKLKSGRTWNQALAKFKVVIASLLQVEIDYYALVKFHGFDDLVHEIEPVTVNIKSRVRDTRYWDDKSKPSGVYFPVDSSYQLYAWQPGGGSPLCNGLFRFQSDPIPSDYWCRRAMPYVRSRKGSSDFARARRQQDFVLAAARRVLNRGAGGALHSLASKVGYQVNIGQFYTDISPSYGNALDLYNIIDGASVGFQVVFSPPTYASHIPGTTAYQLNLAAVRQAAKQWFGGSGTPSVTPAPTVTPSVGPTGSPTAAPTPANSPTANPTGSATATPSALPTGHPTSPPTTNPTGIPTTAPTSQPTALPSAGPSTQPTESPATSSSPASTESPGLTASPPSSSASPVPTPSPGQASTSPGPTTTPATPASPVATPSSAPSPGPDAGGSNDGATMIAAVVVLGLIVGGAVVLLIGWMQLGWFRPR